MNLKIVFLFFFVCNIISAQDLGQGLIFDKDPHPMTPLAKPGLLESVTDPEFGTKIIRITDAGEGKINRTLYNTVQEWNADESLLMLWHGNNTHHLYNGKTYEYIRQLDIRPTDQEHIIWDMFDPNIFYYPTDYDWSGQVRDLIKYNVSTDTKTTLRDFNEHTTEGPNNNSVKFSFGHSQMQSWDNKWFGLAGGDNRFLYNIETNQVSAYGPTTDYYMAPMPAPSGELFVMDGKVYNQNMEYQRTLDVDNPLDHSCMGKLPNGHDAYYAIAFDPGPNGTSGVGSLVAYDITDGSSRVIIGQSTGYPYPPSSTHISALCYQQPYYVCVSVMGGDDKSGQTLLNNEILIADVRDGGKVYRVAHCRTHGKDGPLGYQGEAHATLSPSGTRIIFNSDWGGENSVNTYIIELPVHNSTLAVQQEKGNLVPQIYPNPAHDFIQLTSRGNFINYELYSIEGKKIREAKLNNNQIDVRNLASGVYFLKLINNNQFISFKFIK